MDIAFLICFSWEENILKSQVIEYIQLSKKFVGISLLSTILSLIFAISIVAFFLRFVPPKHQKRLPAKKIFLPVLSVIIILFGVGLFLRSNIVRIQRIIRLDNDINNWETIEASGIVDNRFAFEKGGSAVVIDNETYYILPALGLMDIGESYYYQYLPISKFIVSFNSSDDI